MEPLLTPRRFESRLEPVVPTQNRVGILSRDPDSVSWRAVFAGTLISLLAYLGLLALGLAVGSSSLEVAALGTSNASGIGVGTGFWMVFSIVLSIFAGCFAAARVCGPMPIRIGRIQGLVIACLFFGVVLSQLGSAVGLIGKGVGSTLGTLGSVTGSLAQSPPVQDVMNQTLGGLNLQSPPQTVAAGIATRLIQGNFDDAKNYLAQQAGITPQQADAKIQAIRPMMEAGLRQAGATAARVGKTVGWVMFWSIVFGALAGALGGAYGAKVNLEMMTETTSKKPEKLPHPGKAA